MARLSCPVWLNASEAVAVLPQQLGRVPLPCRSLFPDSASAYSVNQTQKPGESHTKSNFPDQSRLQSLKASLFASRSPALPRGRVLSLNPLPSHAMDWQCLTLPWRCYCFRWSLSPLGEGLGWGVL